MRKAKNKHTTQQTQIEQMSKFLKKQKNILLLGYDKQKIGIMTAKEAEVIAQEQEQDLIVISKTSAPPVVQLGIASKYFYNQKKKQKNIKKNNIQNKQKEVTMRVDIALHDLDNKLNTANKFLHKKQRVKIIINMFHTYKHRKAGISKADLLNTAKNLFEQINNRQLGIISSSPTIEAKSFSFIIYPNN